MEKQHIPPTKGSSALITGMYVSACVEFPMVTDSGPRRIMVSNL